MQDEPKPTTIDGASSTRITVTVRIWAGFCLTAITGIAVFSLWLSNVFRADELQLVEEKTRQTIADVHKLASFMKDAESGARAYIITGIIRHLQSYQVAVTGMPEVVARLRESLPASGLQRNRLELMIELSNNHMAQLKEAIELRRSEGLPATQRYLLGKLDDAPMQKLQALTGELLAEEDELLERGQDEAADLRQQTTYYVILGDGIAFLMLFFAALGTVRSIKQPLRNLVEGVTHFGAGDLTHRIPVLRNDEFGQVAHRVNDMAAELARADANRRKAEHVNASRAHVMELIAAGANLPQVLNAIVRGVEQEHPEMMCSILLLDKEGQRLFSGAAPSLPASFTQAIDGMTIGMGVGSCGTAAFTGERVIVDDIQNHPYWARAKKLAARSGLGACWSEPILSSQGKVLGTFAIYHADIHQPDEAHLQLIEQTAHLASIALEKSRAEMELQLAASVFTHAREGIFITDAAGTIINVNDTFSSLTGYSRAEAIGQNARILRSERHPPEFHAAMWRGLLDNDHWSGEIWNRCKNGDEQAVMLTISAVRDEPRQMLNYVALFTDITAMKDHQRQLEHIAHYDALTGLPNRVLLADRLHQAMAMSQRRNRTLAVAYLDLDGFKLVNDSHGHDVGDELLIALAQRMKNALREGDTLARIGGDEFIAVLVDLDGPSSYEPVLERLLFAAADPAPVRNLNLKVSASIGVTLSPQDSGDVDQLMRHADQAMYVAKQLGKNRYHLFDIHRDAAVKTRHESIERIQLALDQGEFILHYQPKVNLRSGKITGVEALIRWQHPEQGLLAPGYFLPVIEDHPLSIDIGEWVISAALQQIAAWRTAGLELPVSVNIGARQLQQPNFATRLFEILAAHPEIPPCLLELEVLETSGLADITRVAEVMQLCHGHHIGFALDDFGTGYSSLTYLRRLPAGLLKIDQSFVRNMLESPEDLAIVEGVIGLAAAFRRQVIAEGVETAGHGRALLMLDCELAQGYGIARPMPPAEVPGWAAHWQPDPEWQG